LTFPKEGEIFDKKLILATSKMSYAKTRDKLVEWQFLSLVDSEPATEGEE
jgi:hypothetical protein